MSENSAGPGPGGLPPVGRVKDEVERWWQTARATGERALEVFGLAADRAGVPVIDLLLGPDAIVVLVDLPGVRVEGVHLSLNGQLLQIKATRVPEPVSATLSSLLRERISAPFERSIPLPAAVDPESVKAAIHDGVLRVELRRLQEQIGRQIPVLGRTGDSSPVTG